VESGVIMAGLAALIWFMHRENIKRLLSGTERKFLSKKE
jgi:glycerol-3-phosphate acyltransferase PlsY